MPPYNPPASHYSQMSLDEFTPEDMYAFIGKGGRRFYWLTKTLGLDYLWYDDKRHVIEIWGPFFTHKNKQSEHLIRAELENYKNNNLSEEEYLENHIQNNDYFEETATSNQGEGGDGSPSVYQTELIPI